MDGHSVIRVHLHWLLKTFQVETVGDLYMVASGIPTRNDSHAAEIADMALNLVPIISRKDFLPGKTDFDLSYQGNK